MGTNLSDTTTQYKATAITSLVLAYRQTNGREQRGQQAQIHIHIHTWYISNMQEKDEFIKWHKDDSKYATCIFNIMRCQSLPVRVIKMFLHI